MPTSSAAAQAGTLDPTFGKKGVIDWMFPEFSSNAPQAVLSLPDGRLITVSRLTGFPAGFVVARLKASGEIDVGTGYGLNEQGFVEIAFPGINADWIFGVSTLADKGVLITFQFTKMTRATSGLAIVRLLEDGRLDERFGVGGVVFHEPMSGGMPEQADKVQAWMAEPTVTEHVQARLSNGKTQTNGVELPDGKIVLMTRAMDYSVGTMKGMIVRLNSNGTFDETFNGTGRAFVELEGVTGSDGNGVAVQPDGKLVVYGSYKTVGDPGLYVTRFHAEGKQDTQFSNLMWSNPGYQFDFSDIVVRKSDGLIVLVGDSFEGGYAGSGVIFVLNPDGGFNLVFNEGKPLHSRLTNVGETWRRCVFGGDRQDRLIVAGIRGNAFLSDHTAAMTARYFMTGELDLVFNGQGWVVFDDPRWLDTTRDMTLTAEGSIVVCGEYKIIENADSFIEGGWIIRYLA